MTTEPIFTPEQATALADQYDLLIHSTISLPWATETAVYVHTEFRRRLHEWALGNGAGCPDPCCPSTCSSCEEEHFCITDDTCVEPAPGGLSWTYHGEDLAYVTFEVLWSNDKAKTDALIEDLLQKEKDHYLQYLENQEMAERTMLAELQHKYQETS